MNIFKLSLTYIFRRPLGAILNLLLITSGIAIIVTMLLFTKQVEEKMIRDISIVDLVVGAKGSPLQLVLSTVMHVEAPTGNITMADARKIARHPLVRYAVPISLGDNYKGFRIVGTNNFFYSLFGNKSENDNYRIPDKLFEVVIGADVAKKTGLKYGDTFYGVHGVSEHGEEHKDFPYTVVGILEPSGRSLDRLILTKSETVNKIHEHEEKEAGEEESHHKESEEQKRFGDIKFTALLVVYSSPTAAAILPKFVNDETNLMAASPATEITKLLEVMGIGVDAVMIFAYLIITVSAFAIFISLINSLRERSYDISIMRAMGATRFKIFNSIIIEGVIISAAGAIIGIITGHVLTEFIINIMQLNAQINFTGFKFYEEELFIIPAAIIFGLISSLFPAIKAYRYDVASLLSKS